MSKLSPARRLAYQVVSHVRRHQAYTARVLDTRLADKGLHMSASDRAFTRVLALGVASTVGTLDDFINRCLRKPTDIKADVRDALRISTYEILFLDKPAHVAVDQGVDLVRFVKPKAAGLANAVLRKEIRLKPQFPFGDPQTSNEALARSCGFPLWLCEFLIDDLGRDEAWEFMCASNTQAPVYVGVNSIRATSQQVIRKLDDDMTHSRTSAQHQSAASSRQHAASPNQHAAERVYMPAKTEVPGCLKAASAHVVAGRNARQMFANGEILISDAAAQKIASLALPKHFPKNGFLEIGAGRGTKTVLLQSDAQQRYGRQMQLYPLDSEQFKVNLIEKRAKQYGVHTTKTVCVDGRNLDQVFPDKLFDAVFIDAPCSGLGTLRRHPEIRWRITQKDIVQLAILGAQLLVSASTHVAPGGQLTYATCTISHAENEMVVEKFLASDFGKDFRLIRSGISDNSPVFFKTSLHENACDAHFAARMIRNA